MKRALTWVLWTPARASLSLACAAALIIAVPIAIGLGPDEAPAAAHPTPSTTSVPVTERPAPRPSTPASTKTPTRTATTSGEVDEANTNPSDATAARRAAAAWSSAFLAGHGSTTVDWLPTIRPLTHSSYLPFLIATPTSAIPATKVATVGRPDLGTDEGTVLVTWENGVEVTVELIKEKGRWLVSGASE